MNRRITALDSDSLLRTLADFRFEVRRFLHFSEIAATEEGLHPQQHQLLLQLAGAPEGAVVTIAYAAERLGLRHNSVVELVNRSETEGLLVRVADPEDQRRALLRTTRKGRGALGRLSEDHAREIHELAPRLVRALNEICAHERVLSRSQRRNKQREARD